MGKGVGRKIQYDRVTRIKIIGEGSLKMLPAIFIHFLYPEIHGGKMVNGARVKGK